MAKKWIRRIRLSPASKAAREKGPSGKKLRASFMDMLASAGQQARPTSWPGFAQDGRPSRRPRFLGGSGTLTVAVLAVWLALTGAPWLRAATLENSALRFDLVPETGSYTLVDKAAGMTWRSNPFTNRFGEVTLVVDGKPQARPLGAATVKQSADTLELGFSPLPQEASAQVRVRVRLLADPRTLEFEYEADPRLKVESLRLLDQACGATDGGKGYVLVPVRLGLLIPTDSGLAFTQRYDTFSYEGCHMEMLGVVQNGAALLITWHDPYVAAEIRSTTNPPPAVAARQAVTPSLVLRQSARAFRVHVLGRGDHVTVANAYRAVAREKGWLVPWSEKLKGHPERAQLFGAINYKLWSTLSRRMSEDSRSEVSVRVSWTFDEAAQVAEHLKRDLQLDRVLFTLGGWIRRGYDNQHPDILPAAPECGGDDAFAACARRVMQLGYLFCLHDNYQDMYVDAPSWDESFINRNADGSKTGGGHWAGGRAYITCAQKALELAQRPQNLPAVKKLTGANSYFIDTTYAAGLYECFSPVHPMTRADDLKWKAALSDYARGLFGVFGSECGREWAIPHSDFFEGLTGVSGGFYHNKAMPGNVGGVVVPLFELVYRDCIAMYGKYGYDIQQSADYVLHHVGIGRTLNYHNIPAHLYWAQPPANDSRRGAAASSPGEPRRAPDRGIFVDAHNGWADGLHPMDRFVKNTYEILSPLNELTSQTPMTRHQFLTADRSVQRSQFGSGDQQVDAVINTGATDYTHRSQLGGEVLLPPRGFVVEGPTFVAFLARQWNGVAYDAPVLFTLRSLDGRPLRESRQVRVFHGFGDPRIKVGAQLLEAKRETVVR